MQYSRTGTNYEGVHVGINIISCCIGIERQFLIRACDRQYTVHVDSVEKGVLSITRNIEYQLLWLYQLGFLINRVGSTQRY